MSIQEPEPLARCVAAGMNVRLLGEAGPFQARLVTVGDREGVAEVELTLQAPTPAPPRRLQVRWDMPGTDIAGLWRPDSRSDRGLTPYWGDVVGVNARACSHAPVACLFSQDGRNRLTAAGSDALHGSTMGAAVVEEDGRVFGAWTLFATPRAAASTFVLRLRLDRRDVPYERSLFETAAWWAAQPGHAPCAVPDRGRQPVYSTWYAFHKHLDPDRVLAQCRIARELGCGAVIVDDGWQTADATRGYATTGDWEPLRIPDFRGFVGAAQDLGLAFLLWYAVPFAGPKSRTCARLARQVIPRGRLTNGAEVLDPRFPEVREHLIATWARAQAEWGLDGFKFDFVDSLWLGDDMPRTATDGRDCGDLDEASVRLLTDAMARLRERDPNVLVEFRQSYIGPLMRTFGNCFRAGDCPADAGTNRRSILDIRLLCGATACHSDMLMWHPEEPVAAAALQILNVLFSVPQMSVLLDRLPADHLAMVRFWLAWWLEQRDVLLDGALEPLLPQHLYPVVRASTATKRVVAVYADGLAPLGPQLPPRCWVVNGTRRERVVLECEDDLGRRQVTVRDCCGRVVASGVRVLPVGVHALAVPPAGLVELAG